VSAPSLIYSAPDPKEVYMTTDTPFDPRINQCKTASYDASGFARFCPANTSVGSEQQSLFYSVSQTIPDLQWIEFIYAYGLYLTLALLLLALA